MLAVPIHDLLRRLWRTFLASLVMFLLVRRLLAYLGAASPDSSGILVLLLGIALYALLLAPFWLASGRGQGAENRLLKLLRQGKQ